MDAGYAELRIWAEMLDDAMKTRIGAKNRAERGDLPGSEDIFLGHVALLESAEDECAKQLHRCFRRVAPASVIAWQKSALGVGEHLLSRLLGHIGHPIATVPKHWEGKGKGARVLVEGEAFHRNVSQLWSYCGHGDPSRKRKAGMTADEAMSLGKPLVKALVHLMAEGAIKAGVRVPEEHKGSEPSVATRTALSPYAAVYLSARDQYATRTHADVCVRCGPSGKPAQPGSPWSKAHQHAAALRLVGKTILRDLWVEARKDLGGEVETIADPTPKKLASPSPRRNSRGREVETNLCATPKEDASSSPVSDFDADADDAWVREQFENLVFVAA